MAAAVVAGVGAAGICAVEMADAGVGAAGVVAAEIIGARVGAAEEAETCDCCSVSLLAVLSVGIVCGLVVAGVVCVLAVECRLC